LPNDEGKKIRMTCEQCGLIWGHLIGVKFVLCDSTGQDDTDETDSESSESSESSDESKCDDDMDE
jgi:hypothetical protein